MPQRFLYIFVPPCPALGRNTAAAGAEKSITLLQREDNARAERRICGKPAMQRLTIFRQDRQEFAGRECLVDRCWCGPLRMVVGHDDTGVKSF